MRLIVEMTFISVPLLALFYVLDRFYYKKEKDHPPAEGETVPFRINGAHNLFFLGGIVGAVLMSGVWRPEHINILGIHVPVEGLARDGALILMGLLSLRTTRSQIHKENGFSWFPIKEVAFLFAGIFMTIIPAIAILKAGKEGGFAFIMDALETPAHYFWITGALSGFLDNAPSYLTFFNSLLGKFFPGSPDAVQRLIAEQGVYLRGLSLGAVFWGAVTYIGNAPNFMVKSISEEAGVKMPSFFGYMIKYSLPILLPLFLLLTVIFF